MSEQPNEVSEDQETDTQELTDDEIWEQAGKATAEVTPEPEPEPEKVEEEDDRETIEVEEPVAEEGPSDSDYEVAEVEAKVRRNPSTITRRGTKILNVNSTSGTKSPQGCVKSIRNFDLNGLV